MGKGGPSGCITAPESLAWAFWKRGHIMLTCVGLSTFSKDWKRTNESKPGAKDGKACDLLLKAKGVCSQVTGFLLLDFPRC